MVTTASSGSFLISPNVGLMIWTLLLFGLSMVILWKLAFPRISEALDRRQKAIEDSIEMAERTRRDADELLAEYRERLREARDQAEQSAQVYARSLFEVAEEAGLLDVIREQLSQFVDALNENRELATFFFSPYFSTEEKKDGLHRVIEGAEDVFVSFLEALVERHRMPAIFRIRARYEKLWDEANQLLPVQVTSAVELDDETVSAIGERIREQT